MQIGGDNTHQSDKLRRGDRPVALSSQKTGNAAMQLSLILDAGHKKFH
jgi:hypothetical protein